MADILKCLTSVWRFETWWLQICLGLNANSIKIPHDKHHKVSSLVKKSPNHTQFCQIWVIWEMSNNPAKCEILINWTILAYNPGRHKWREYYWKHRACAYSFKSLENKEKLSFICFDVCEFYPSINEKLLSKALDFASTYRPISRHERGIILHAKRSLLFSNYSTWKKKSSNDFFDVTVGSFDGA